MDLLLLAAAFWLVLHPVCRCVSSGFRLRSVMYVERFFVNIYQDLCFWGSVFCKFDKMCIPVNVIAICVDGTYGGYRRWTGKLFLWFTAGVNPLTIIGFCGL